MWARPLNTRLSCAVRFAQANEIAREARSGASTELDSTGGEAKDYSFRRPAALDDDRDRDSAPPGLVAPASRVPRRSTRLSGNLRRALDPERALAPAIVSLTPSIKL